MRDTITISMQHWMELRFVLLLGWLILATWFGATLVAEFPRRKKVEQKWDPGSYCKVGSQQSSTCPHCKAKGDPPE